jgi:hypothetical protein
MAIFVGQICVDQLGGTIFRTIPFSCSDWLVIGWFNLYSALIGRMEGRLDLWRSLKITNDQ